jgi:ubiquinone/menaquinone biosynthesis C-methylase UbiE
MAYFYPDKSDQITLSLVLLTENSAEELELTEDIIFSSAENLFKRSGFHSLLDIGCGKGRLIARFSKYFETVTALDPDGWRLKQARDSLKNHGIRNVEYIEALFQDAQFPDEHFDVVVCNQMIQHLDTNMIAPLMRGVFRILKKNGSLLLTTSCSHGDEDYFLKSFVKNGTVQSAEINKKEFNGLMTNDREVLPIHYFSKETLKKHLSEFREVALSVYDDIFPHPMLDTIMFMGEKPG